MKVNKKNFLLIVIMTLVVLNACDLETGIENVSREELVSIEENPYTLDEKIILANAKYFFQSQNGVNMGLRSEQIENNSYEIEVKNVTTLLAQKSTVSRQVAQQIPIYIIQYKDEAGKAAGYLVTIGDDRFDNKVLMFSDEEQFVDYEQSDFWKDRVNGYIYNVVNSFDEEKVKMRSLGQFRTYLLKIGTSWHQYGKPYNDYTPFRGEGKDRARASVGCAAVAMGQIMAYHQWPKYGAYEKYDDNEVLKREGVSYHYTWPLVNDYNTQIPTNPSARIHVSNLLAEIAYKLNTNFVSATAAYADDRDVPVVFSQMGYNSEYLTSMTKVGESVFFEKIRYEIADCERPVFMVGRSERGGGHAFVIGGIQTDGQDLKNVAYLYIMNGDGHNSQGRRWYLSDMFRTPSSSIYVGTYVHRYNSSIITGIYPNPSKPGSSSLFKVSENNPY